MQERVIYYPQYIFFLTLLWELIFSDDMNITLRVISCLLSVISTSTCYFLILYICRLPHSCFFIFSIIHYNIIISTFIELLMMIQCPLWHSIIWKDLKPYGLHIHPTFWYCKSANVNIKTNIHWLDIAMHCIDCS